MKIDDWSNVSALKGSKYDRATTTPRATSTIQIGTSGTDPLPKNSYIKVIQEATGVHTNLVDTAVSIEDKGVTSTTTPTERNGNNSTSITTVDISGMPPGEIKTLTAAFQEMTVFIQQVPSNVPMNCGLMGKRLILKRLTRILALLNLRLKLKRLTRTLIILKVNWTEVSRTIRLVTMNSTFPPILLDLSH